MAELRRNAARRVSGPGVSRTCEPGRLNYDDCGRDKVRSPQEITAKVRAEVLRRNPDLAALLEQKEQES